MEKLDIDRVTQDNFARIHRAALVLSGNPWDADDLAQETFLVLSSQADRFQGKSSIYTWLYGILLNLDRRERRRYAIRHRKLKVIWDNEPEERTCPPAETRIEVSEWKTSLWAWVEKLPDGQRHALILRFSEGLPYDQIAEILECPLGTVKSRIFHGLGGLRRLMDNEDDNARDLPAFPQEDITNAV